MVTIWWDERTRIYMKNCCKTKYFSTSLPKSQPPLRNTVQSPADTVLFIGGGNLVNPRMARGKTLLKHSYSRSQECLALDCLRRANIPIPPQKNRSSGRACFKNRSVKRYVWKSEQLQCVRIAVDRFFKRIPFYLINFWNVHLRLIDF